MEEDWTILRDAGVPYGAFGPEGLVPFDDDLVREAVSGIASDRASLADPQRDALLAWLRGFRQHFPDRFAACLGSEGDSLIEALEQSPIDPNRYLKLRRIAVANLSRLI